MTFIKTPVALAIFTSLVAQTTFAEETSNDIAAPVTEVITIDGDFRACLLYTSPSPRDRG